MTLLPSVNETAEQIQYLNMVKLVKKQKKRIAELERELAAAQATIQQMREALERISEWDQNTQDSVEANGMGLAMWRGCVAEASIALALPADRTALDAMLADAEKQGMLEAAGICDTEWNRLKEIEAAHYRNSSEPFDPSRFFNNISTIRALHTRADSIRQAAERGEG